MLYARTSLVVALLFSSVAQAEEKPRPPATLAPQVCMATADKKDGAIQIRVSVPRMIPYRMARQVPDSFVIPTEDGKPQIITVLRTVTETHYKALVTEAVLVADGKEVQVSRKDGKVVAPEDLPRLLKKEGPVVVFTQGEIDPYYLQVIQDQALIIVIPANRDFPGRPKFDK